MNRVARNGVYLCLQGGKQQARYNCVSKKYILKNTYQIVADRFV